MNNEKLNSHSPSHYNTTTHVCHNVIQPFAISNNYVTPVAIVCILVHEKRTPLLMPLCFMTASKVHQGLMIQ